MLSRILIAGNLRNGGHSLITIRLIPQKGSIMSNPQSLKHAWRKCKSRTRTAQLAANDMSGWQLYLKRLNVELGLRGHGALTGPQLAQAYDAYVRGNSIRDTAKLWL